MAEKKGKRWERPQILSDLPLRQEDEAYFHFNEFAGTLALLIADPQTRTPLSIGVSGPWGSGKTTLLHRVKTLLEMHDPDIQPYFASAGETARDFRACKTVWFDAWKYTDEAELLVALVRAILMAMKNDGLLNKIRAVSEDPQQPKYDLLNMFISAFQFKFGGLGAEIQVKFDPDKFEKESPFASHTAFFDYFDEAFVHLLALWVHGKGNPRKIDESKAALVVFIDDLDRCLPEKTVQVLEAVKLFLDKPGCIFLIGAYTQTVQEAVTKYYTGMSAETASDYLEKIIQLRFELPPILENQMGDFLDRQKKEKKLAPEALENWETIVTGAEINPRKVKTFFNDLNLAWALLVNSGQAENVERADFTRWQVLMRASPDSFKKKVHEFDDQDLLFKFVQSMLAWAKGDVDAAKFVEGFEFSKNDRLRRTLKKIGAFGPRFDARTLDAFIHLVAPPKPPEAEKAPTEVKLETGKAAAQGLKAEVPAEERGGEASERGAAKLEKAPPKGVVERVFGGIRFVPVPKGKFLMGSRDDNKLAFDEEKSQHTVEIPYEYWMGQFCITNQQFASFVEASGIVTLAEKEGGWTGSAYKKGYDWRHPLGPKDSFEKKMDHPVVQINWYEARAFCDWLNQAYGAELPQEYSFRLPSEAEWEKAGRGEFGFEWPWGNEFDPNRCNTEEGGKKGTTPVGLYSPAGDSPYGCADMVGNVWEWTQSLWKPYPYNAKDGRENLKAGDFRVVRGGSFYDFRRGVRCAYRGRNSPGYFGRYLGFRVVVSPI
jgi:iron(II)-dependent oxidoreductase